MTPAERALLLAVAKLLAAKHFPDGWRRSLTDAIAAVEAEAAPEATAEAESFGDKCSVCGSDPCECRACPTCRFEKGAECLAEGGYALDDNGICQDWQPKPTEADVCPTCENGRIFGKWTKCPRCGTGKKEKKLCAGN